MWEVPCSPAGRTGINCPSFFLQPINATGHIYTQYQLNVGPVGCRNDGPEHQWAVTPYNGLTGDQSIYVTTSFTLKTGILEIVIYVMMLRDL